MLRMPQIQDLTDLANAAKARMPGFSSLRGATPGAALDGMAVGPGNFNDPAQQLARAAGRSTAVAGEAAPLGRSLVPGALRPVANVATRIGSGPVGAAMILKAGMDLTNLPYAWGTDAANAGAADGGNSTPEGLRAIGARMTPTNLNGQVAIDRTRALHAAAGVPLSPEDPSPAAVTLRNAARSVVPAATSPAQGSLPTPGYDPAKGVDLSATSPATSSQSTSQPVDTAASLANARAADPYYTRSAADQPTGDNTPQQYMTRTGLRDFVVKNNYAGQQGIKRIDTAGQSPLFTNQSVEQAVKDNDYGGRGFVGTVASLNADGAPETAEQRGLRNARNDLATKDLYYTKMAAVHGGNAEDYMPGGKSDGGEGQRNYDAIGASLRSPDVRVRQLGFNALASQAQLNQQRLADGQDLAIKRDALRLRAAQLPYEQAKSALELQKMQRETQLLGQPTPDQLSSNALANQTASNAEREKATARYTAAAGGDATKGGDMVNRLDNTYSTLRAGLEQSTKDGKQNQVLKALGLNTTQAAQLLKGMSDTEGKPLDLFAPGNTNTRTLVENLVKRSQKVASDSGLVLGRINGDVQDALDNQYWDETAMARARNGSFFNPFSVGADKLYGTRPTLRR